MEHEDQGLVTVGNIGRKQGHLLCIIFLQQHKFSIVAAVASHMMAAWIQPSMQMLLHPCKSMWKDIQRLCASSHISVSDIHSPEIFLSFKFLLISQYLVLRSPEKYLTMVQSIPNK